MLDRTASLAARAATRGLVFVDCVIFCIRHNNQPAVRPAGLRLSCHSCSIRLVVREFRFVFHASTNPASISQISQTSIARHGSSHVLCSSRDGTGDRPIHLLVLTKGRTIVLVQTQLPSPSDVERRTTACGSASVEEDLDNVMSWNTLAAAGAKPLISLLSSRSVEVQQPSSPSLACSRRVRLGSKNWRRGLWITLQRTLPTRPRSPTPRRSLVRPVVPGMLMTAALPLTRKTTAKQCHLGLFAGGHSRFTVSQPSIAKDGGR